jgi:two-component system response regulator ArlR
LQGAFIDRMAKKILIIEDNQDLAHLLEGHLRDLAYQVDLSFDGLSGLAKADTCNYDLIILDAENPDLFKVVFFVS